MEHTQLNSFGDNCKKNISSEDISPLIEIIEALRGENGCPWDKKQTSHSMAVYLIEEMYELTDAISSDNPEGICEELGDVLFHLLFIVSLFQEQNKFGLADVLDRISKKMTRRHPHVFGDKQIKDAEDVKRQWHKIKQKEKKEKQETSVLDSIPISLPALMRSYRISERAARMDFDWNDIRSVMKKAQEEWHEFKSEITVSPDGKPYNPEAAMEFGDLLFTLVNVARFAGIHPETALSEATRKFEKRFKYMERTCARDGKSFESVPREQKEHLWNMAKAQE